MINYTIDIVLIILLNCLSHKDLMKQLVLHVL